MDIKDARENWEVWAVDIKDELNEYALQSKPSRASTSETISKIKPSIFDGKWDHSINQFWIGMFIYHSHGYPTEVRKHLWDNAKFMTRWLGLDINRCVQFIDENHGLVQDHYAFRLDEMQHGVRNKFQYSSRLLGGSGDQVKHLLLASCAQCFAILLFQKVRNGTQILKGTAENNSHDLTDQRSLQFLSLYRLIMRDPMRTKLDMLNLTNQIPWFVVEAVFTNSNLSKLFGTSLDRLAMTCFDDLYPRANKSKVQSGSIPSGGFRHLLHIFHWTRTPEGKWLVDTQLEQEESLKQFAEFYIPNATNLLRSATTFKRLDGGSLEVIFSKKRVSGVMQLTPLHIFPYSNEMLQNLLIFEQMYLDCGLPFTAHFACMKSLLQTKEDAGLMQKNGIVQNTLTGEEDVLSFVRDMGKFLRDNLNARIPEELNCLSEEVVKHHDNTASREYYEFKRQFCPSRWVFISIFAATILFVLTIIQTIYTGLGYYKT